MARKSNDSELRELWQGAAAAGDDGMRAMVQQVLEAEMTSFLGAETYQRTGERRGYWNGYKPRLLKTRVGELELLVPKDRDGQFQTELFERYQRSEKALVLAIMQMFVEGGIDMQGARHHRSAVGSGDRQGSGFSAGLEVGRRGPAMARARA